MKSPCNMCIVSSMCKDPCLELRNYINKKVLDVLQIGDIRCSDAFLEAVSKMIRDRRTFNHKITNNNHFFTMKVNNTDIVVIPSPRGVI